MRLLLNPLSAVRLAFAFNAPFSDIALSCEGLRLVSIFTRCQSRFSGAVPHYLNMTTKLAPTVRLNNGKEIPVLGLGTWKVRIAFLEIVKHAELLC